MNKDNNANRSNKKNDNNKYNNINVIITYIKQRRNMVKQIKNNNEGCKIW